MLKRRQFEFHEFGSFESQSCTGACTQPPTPTHTHTQTHSHTFTHTHTHTRARMCLCMYVRMYVHMCTRVGVCVYIYIYICATPRSYLLFHGFPGHVREHVPKTLGRIPFAMRARVSVSFFVSSAFYGGQAYHSQT